MTLSVCTTSPASTLVAFDGRASHMTRDSLLLARNSSNWRLEGTVSTTSLVSCTEQLVHFAVHEHAE